MSRSRRRSGRQYQPYPQRRSHWGARILIVLVGAALFVGVVAIAFSR